MLDLVLCPRRNKRFVSLSASGAQLDRSPPIDTCVDARIAERHKCPFPPGALRTFLRFQRQFRRDRSIEPRAKWSVSCFMPCISQHMSIATPDRSIATHCPYCALQCGMLVGGSRDSPEVLGNAKFPVNKGGLCVKGWTAGATLGHRDRLTTPLVRSADGALVPASWDTALDRIAHALKEVQRQSGRDAVGVFGGGSLTNEKAYLL